jgi:hypothetical protein
VIIDERKITEYLLSPTHPVGRFKAAFFNSFGFRSDDWTALRDAPLDHATVASVVADGETEFGHKLVLEGPLNTPSGRAPQICSVWFRQTGTKTHRLVTAHPGKRAE